MEYSKLFAMRIRQLCAKHGTPINKLAAMSGLKQSTIDNIIRGTSRNPKIKTLHKIAVTSIMTLSEFLDFPEPNDYLIEEAYYFLHLGRHFVLDMIYFNHKWRARHHIHKCIMQIYYLQFKPLKR